MRDVEISAMQERLAHPAGARRARGLACEWTSLHGRSQPMPSWRRSTRADSVTRTSELARLHVYDAVVQRPGQALQDMGSKFRPCMRQQHTMVHQPHLADQPHIRACMSRERNVRVVTNTMRSPVRLATRGMREATLSRRPALTVSWLVSSACSMWRVRGSWCSRGASPARTPLLR
jgi:hypothetical protein